MGCWDTRFAWFVVLAGGWVAGSAIAEDHAGPGVGDQAPDFTVTDDQGKDWRLQDHLGPKWLVIFFYPSDFSFCCTRQVGRYRNHHQELAQCGAAVVGISGDATQAHRLFKESQSLNFSLLSDVDGRVATLFGVPLRSGGKALAQDAAGKTIAAASGKPLIIPRRVTAARWTFVIDKTGRIIYRENVVNPVKDSRQVLQFLRDLDPAKFAAARPDSD